MNSTLLPGVGKQSVRKLTRLLKYTRAVERLALASCDDTAARRRRILLGLECGPEPSIDAWGCERDLFDPRWR